MNKFKIPFWMFIGGAENDLSKDSLEKIGKHLISGKSVIIVINELPYRISYENEINISLIEDYEIT